MLPKNIKTDKLPFNLPPVMVHRTMTKSDAKAMVATEGDKISWAKKLLHIVPIWFKFRGKGVRVAVLDTGVDTDHPDLAAAIVGTADFTGDGVEDQNGHGTHCAGIIAARLNDFGFVGVAPEADLLIGKVLNNEGSGQIDWIVNGINWAVEQKADIISMSLGGFGSAAEIFVAIHQALAKGSHVICAAGNSGSLYQNSIGYPGRYGSVITVASHDWNGNVSGFSSRGGEIDFLAPGSEIFSTYLDGGFNFLSGTSMATPFVAGLAALVIDKHKQTPDNETPINNNEDLKEHLLRMATHPGYHDNARGYGVLQPFQFFYGDLTG